MVDIRLSIVKHVAGFSKDDFSSSLRRLSAIRAPRDQTLSDPDLDRRLPASNGDSRNYAVRMRVILPRSDNVEEYEASDD